MTKKIYIGNLSYELNNNDLKELFESHGTVNSANVIMDRNTGRSKGFGFVEMENEAEADAAINALNGTEVNGRTLTVNQARPQEERGPRSPKRY